MKRMSKLLMVLSVLALGACEHYSDDLASLDGSMKTNQTTLAYASAAPVSPQDIAPAAGGPAATGGSINTFLAREYYDLARYENDKAYDYKAAKQYTKKAVSAQKGQFTGPSKISAFDIPSQHVGELTQARSDLIAALKTQNTPENGPALAKAQSSFDCWLERAEEADEDTHFAECKTQFEQSMAMLIMPAAGEADASTVFQIGFLQTSAVPDDASKNRIEYIANYLLKPENAPLKVALSAPADEVGTARIAAVQNAFAAKGVTPDRITIVPSEAIPATVPPTQAVNDGVKVVFIGSTQVTTTTTTTKFVPVTPGQIDPATVGPSVHHELPVMPKPAPVTQ